MKNNNNLIISYKKVKQIGTSRTGYTDIEEVSKRHIKYININKSNKGNITSAVMDFQYFINNECKEYIYKTKMPVRILDVGCGNGEYSYFFDKLVGFKSKYQGCEISDSMVSVCKKTSPKKIFFKSFADNIDSEDEKFDLVFCSGTLQYTIDRWKESLLEMKRVSNKYIAVLRLPVIKFGDTCFVEQNIKSEGYLEKNFFILINRQELENLIKRIGLKIVVRDYSSEEYIIEGISEKVILVQYLLAKR